MFGVCQFTRSAQIGAEAILVELMNDSSTEANRTMTRIPKALLAVSLTAFAVGSVVTFGSSEIPVGWTVAMPVGAIFFGLFLVTFMLQKEVASFDEEERVRLELAERYAARPANAAAIAVSTTATNLTPAHSH